MIVVRGIIVMRIYVFMEIVWIFLMYFNVFVRWDGLVSNVIILIIV